MHMYVYIDVCSISIFVCKYTNKIHEHVRMAYDRCRMHREPLSTHISGSRGVCALKSAKCTRQTPTKNTIPLPRISCASPSLFNAPDVLLKVTGLF